MALTAVDSCWWKVCCWGATPSSSDSPLGACHAAGRGGSGPRQAGGSLSSTRRGSSLDTARWRLPSGGAPRPEGQGPHRLGALPVVLRPSEGDDGGADGEADDGRVERGHGPELEGANLGAQRGGTARGERHSGSGSARGVRAEGREKGRRVARAPGCLRGGPRGWRRGRCRRTRRG